MTSDSPHAGPSAIAEQGIAALRAGDGAKARVLFEGLVSAGHADASVYLALGYAHASLRDMAAAVKAAGNVLSLEPRNLRALLLTADGLAALDDHRGASAHYLAVVRAASVLTEIAPDLKPEIARAQAMCEHYASRLEASVRTKLTRLDSELTDTSWRFDLSVDAMFGRAKVYHQEPRYYFLPGLPAVPFYDRKAFPWLVELEAVTPDIRAELQEVLRDESRFHPYIQGDPARPHKDQDGMLNNPAWSAFYLWKNGDPVHENMIRCPKTVAAMSQVPLVHMANRSPSVLFSLLRPGAHIPPHSGLANTRLIGHLPVIVPPGCRFRVGHKTRDWVEGKAWLFDDTIEHEAWNDSEELRVILIFEVWQPALTDGERRRVCALFDAIDSERGDKPAWEI